jgi:membrane fusion protein, copper/silver efflux system
MTRRTLAIVAAGIILVIGAGYGAYSIGMNRGMKMATPPAAPAESGRKILYWHDPMVPGP